MLFCMSVHIVSGTPTLSKNIEKMLTNPSTDSSHVINTP